jgi:hypothetical protein
VKQSHDPSKMPYSNDLKQDVERLQKIHSDQMGESFPLSHTNFATFREEVGQDDGNFGDSCSPTGDGAAWVCHWCDHAYRGHALGMGISSQLFQVVEGLAFLTLSTSQQSVKCFGASLRSTILNRRMLTSSLHPSWYRCN